MKYRSSSSTPSSVIVSPRRLFDARAQSGEIVFDAAQIAALEAFDALHAQLTALPPSFSFFKKRESPKGIYLWGSVGRGKTMLMDLFYQSLPDDMEKGRWHFHAFMLKVHDYLHQSQKEGGARAMDDVLMDCADHFADAIRILCFDELVVRDVADAMLLSRLFGRMIERGTTLVFTSNSEPDDLYAGGWQRERFLPFIALINSRLRVIEVNAGRDFRLRNMAVDDLYHTPPNNVKMSAIFSTLTGDDLGGPLTVLVKGHQVHVPQAAGRVAYFHFDDLCARPLAAVDYLALAERFDTFLINHVPIMTDTLRNEARRFINLIDALYDTRRRLVIGAVAEIGDLCVAHDNAMEFKRTASRLKEMRTQAYWDAAGA